MCRRNCVALNSAVAGFTPKKNSACGRSMLASEGVARRIRPGLAEDEHQDNDNDDEADDDNNMDKDEDMMAACLTYKIRRQHPVVWSSSTSLPAGRES